LKATLFHRSACMLDQDLMEPGNSCPFCASTERIPVAILQEMPEVSLLYCRTCHGASASRMPKPKALEEYYSHYYDDKEEKITLDTPDRMACHIQRHAGPSMGNLIGQEVSILDYGGGDGSISIRLAQKLLKQGAGKVSIALVDYDRRILISRPESLDEIPEQSMDLVIASAVIEHVPEPRQILGRLFSSLKQGGVFYARTPYVTPLSKLTKVFGVRFDFTYPAHVHDLGARFWNNIPNMLPLTGKYRIIRSTPSIVETSFGQHFLRTLVAHMLKMPGYVFKESYGLVGGWEVFIQRIS
jgi:SAM-dependent methyltransferase